jgi:hypothetical protein
MLPRPLARLRQQIHDLGEHAIQGNLVESLMRCGTPSCGCHQDPKRRHGPHLYLKFRDAEGRSRSLYIPRSHEGEVRAAVLAWSQMRQGMLELSQHNREALKERLRRRPRD